MKQKHLILTCAAALALMGCDSGTKSTTEPPVDTNAAVKAVQPDAPTAPPAAPTTPAQPAPPKTGE